jgi:DNA-binding GntR family transcriptional regulator
MTTDRRTVPNRQNEIRAWLENEILEGHLRPGHRIGEQEICEKFAVSRTPVREALLQLASVELIEFRPRQGAVVLRISVRQIAAMWEVMTSLEGLCAELAARRMNHEERNALQAVHDRSRQVVAQEDVAGYDECNREFHEIVYAGCRNDYLATHVRDIRRRLRVYRRYPFQRAGGMERSLAGHEAVLKALTAGEDVAAGSAMREHVAGGLSFLDLVAELPAGAVADDEGPEFSAKGRPRTRREAPATAAPRQAQLRPRPKHASK